MSSSLSKFYQVRDEDRVTLKITIGNGQVGTTSADLDNKQLVHRQKNSLELALGIGKELNGKTLFCMTTVSDVRTETNETSVTYEMTGGTRLFRQTLQESVESEGGVIFYGATFRFYI